MTRLDAIRKRLNAIKAPVDYGDTGNADDAYQHGSDSAEWAWRPDIELLLELADAAKPLHELVQYCEQTGQDVAEFLGSKHYFELMQILTRLQQPEHSDGGPADS